MSSPKVLDDLAAEPGPLNESSVDKKKRVYTHHETYMDDEGLSYIYRRESKITKEM